MSSLRSIISCRTLARTDMSSAATGSSATISSGWVMSARAMTTRCFCPPDRSSGYTSRKRSAGTRPHRSSIATTSRRASAREETNPWIRSGWPTPCPTVMAGFSDALGSWKTIAISRRSGRKPFSGRPTSSWPFQRTEPNVAGTSPRIVRPSDVLPEPDSPTRPKISPRRTSNETPSTARTVAPEDSSPAPTWKWVCRSRICRIASSAPVPGAPAVTGAPPRPGRRPRRAGRRPGAGWSPRTAAGRWCGSRRRRTGSGARTGSRAADPPGPGALPRWR